MKKKLLVISLATLLLLSAAACGESGTENETGTGTGVQIPAGTDPSATVGTNDQGNAVTNAPEETTPPQIDVSEDNPTFTEINKTLYVFCWSANVRSSTNANDSENIIGHVQEGDLVTATGESKNWYRINFEDKTAYIAKIVAGDNAAISGMTEVDNEEIEVTADQVNIRSYPSTEGDTQRYIVTKGTKLTRVAKGENWSCVLYTVTSETETSADGTPVETVKRYFIYNEYIKPTATETATETATTTAE